MESIATDGRRTKDGPPVIGADDHQVVILYHQRGVSPSGERFDGEVIGLYELRDFRLSRAQMFYFDEAALVRFLDRAANELKQAKHRGLDHLRMFPTNTDSFIWLSRHSASIRSSA
jgi:hypothetical protein